MFINNFLINPLEQFYFFSTDIVNLGSFNKYLFPYLLLFLVIQGDLILNENNNTIKNFLKLNLVYFILLAISYL
jgi:hypothetical protein